MAEVPYARDYRARNRRSQPRVSPATTRHRPEASRRRMPEAPANPQGGESESAWLIVAVVSGLALVWWLFV